MMMTLHPFAKQFDPSAGRNAETWVFFCSSNEVRGIIDVTGGHDDGPDG
jgi:hypothetical protein